MMKGQGDEGVEIAADTEVARRLLAEALSREGGLSPRRKQVGEIVYRCFVPLLLALEGEEEAESRFRSGMRALVAGTA